MAGNPFGESVSTRTRVPLDLPRRTGMHCSSVGCSLITRKLELWMIRPPLRPAPRRASIASSSTAPEVASSTDRVPQHSLHPGAPLDLHALQARENTDPESLPQNRGRDERDTPCCGTGQGVRKRLPLVQVICLALQTGSRA